MGSQVDSGAKVMECHHPVHLYGAVIWPLKINKLDASQLFLVELCLKCRAWVYLAGGEHG